jgi:hypothetical protein
MAEIEKIDTPVSPVGQDGFQEIELSEADKNLLSEQNADIQKMLHDLGCLEMDYEISKTKLRQQISERKARFDTIISDKISLFGGQGTKGTDIQLDFNAGKLRFR